MTPQRQASNSLLSWVPPIFLSRVTAMVAGLFFVAVAAGVVFSNTGSVVQAIRSPYPKFIWAVSWELRIRSGAVVSAAASFRRFNLLVKVGVLLVKVPQNRLLFVVCVCQHDDAVGQIRKVLQVLLECGASVHYHAKKVVQVSTEEVHHFVGKHCRVVGGAKSYGIFGQFGFSSCGSDATKNVFPDPHKCRHRACWRCRPPGTLVSRGPTCRRRGRACSISWFFRSNQLTPTLRGWQWQEGRCC